MEISPEKHEMNGIFKTRPVRCKIDVNNKCLQHINNFRYLGCETFYQNEMDIQQKLAKFAEILGILNNTLQPTLVQKFSEIKVNNALVLPILLYGSKIWTHRKKDQKTNDIVEIKFSGDQPGTQNK